MSILTTVGSAPTAPSSVVQLVTLPPPPPAPVALVATPYASTTSGRGTVLVFPRFGFDQAYCRECRMGSRPLFILTRLLPSIRTTVIPVIVRR